MNKVRTSLLFLVCISIVVFYTTKTMWSRVLLAAAGIALAGCVIYTIAGYIRRK